MRVWEGGYDQPCTMTRNRKKHVNTPRSAQPSRTFALANFLKVTPNALIQHLTNPWCFSHGGKDFLVMTLEEARSACARGIENLLPAGIPADTLARYATKLAYDEAITRIQRIQKRRDKEIASEDLLELLDERWASGLIEKDGLDYWLEKTTEARFVGRAGPYYIYTSVQ